MQELGQLELDLQNLEEVFVRIEVAELSSKTFLLILLYHSEMVKHPLRSNKRDQPLILLPIELLGKVLLELDPELDKRKVDKELGL